MGRVGSVAFQVSNIIKAHNGIRISKLGQRAKSGIKSENNQNVSDLFHSYKSLDNARRDLMNLGKFAKAEFGIKDMSQIDAEVIKNWIQSKEVIYETASNYLSELNKVNEHFNFKKEEIKEIRTELKSNLTHYPSKYETRAYKKLNEIKNDLKNEKSQISYTLQSEYGLRAKEATHINLQRQLKENTLFVQGKGGKIVEKELDKDLVALIQKNAKNGIYELNYKTYARDLKESVEKTGQKYNGTHGFRHSFAQKKLEEGYSKQEVSEMMGHNREEITNSYLR